MTPYFWGHRACGFELGQMSKTLYRVQINNQAHQNVHFILTGELD